MCVGFVVDMYGFLLRRLSRGGMPDLEFDGVSGVLPRSDSFNDNSFTFGEPPWRSTKLHISDGAASSSGEEVICLFFLWWLLRWCRRRWIDVGLSYRFILSLHICKIGSKWHWWSQNGLTCGVCDLRAPKVQLCDQKISFSSCVT